MNQKYQQNIFHTCEHLFNSQNFKMMVWKTQHKMFFGQHVKGIVHPKMKMCCLSAYPQSIQDVDEFVSSVEHKTNIFYLKPLQSVSHIMAVNGTHGFESKTKHTQTKPN